MGYFDDDESAGNHMLKPGGILVVNNDGEGVISIRTCGIFQQLRSLFAQESVHVANSADPMVRSELSLLL